MTLPGGGLTIALLLVLTAIYPISLVRAAWTEGTSHLPWLALLAVLAALRVSRAGSSPNSFVKAHVVGAVLGGAAVTVLTGMSNGGMTAVGTRLNDYLTPVLSGESAGDPIFFALMLGATVWGSAFVSAIALARGRVWTAVIVCGACLLVNASLSLASQLVELVLFSVCALFLVLRLRLAALDRGWRARGIEVPPGEGVQRKLARSGVLWAVVLIVAALGAPRVDASELGGETFRALQGPYRGLEAEWQRFFSGIGRAGRLPSIAFTDAVRLGEAPELSNEEVMAVRSSEERFWRGIVYDLYTGTGWRTSEVNRTGLVIPAYAARRSLTIDVEALVTHGDLLFAPNEPTSATVPYEFRSGSDKGYSTSMRTVGNRAPATYRATALYSVADKQSLRAAPTTYEPHIASIHRQLPTTLPERVRVLADNIVRQARANNPYDRAEAIESYLRTHYRYSTNVLPAPPDRDPIDFFLFDLKEDFCEYFASAMVVMLRSVGVPARLVEGYTTGIYDSQRDRYVVRGTDAHAWVEAFFPGYGWIEFEPTPSQPVFSRPETPLPIESDVLDEPGSPAVPPPVLEDLSAGLDDPSLGGGGQAPTSGSTGDGFPIDLRPILAVLALLLAIVGGLVLRFQLRFRGLSSVDAAWAKTRALGAYVGLAPAASQTAYEYADSLAALVPQAREPLRTIAHARVLERYSAGGASAAQRLAAARAWTRVVRDLLPRLPRRVLSAARLARAQSPSSSSPSNSSE